MFLCFLQLLRNCGCKIDDINSKATDDFLKSVGSLEIYKGLASEAYLSQVNEDPIETAFKLSTKLRYLSHVSCTVDILFESSVTFLFF